MIGKILALPNDDTRKILFVAFILCLLCSLVVSTATVYLRPLQAANKALDRKKNILDVAGLLAPGIDIDQRFAQRIESRIVDLDSGEFAVDMVPEPRVVQVGAPRRPNGWSFAVTGLECFANRLRLRHLHFPPV